jgi:hypothetical protein
MTTLWWRELGRVEQQVAAVFREAAQKALPM